jgi:hypothetical protein
MDTTAVQKMDKSMIVDKIVPVAWLVMEGAMRVGGLHLIPSLREGGAAARYIKESQTTYKSNLIVEGVIESINNKKGEPKEKVDLKNFDTAEVMKSLDEINPILEAEGEQGVQAKDFIYGLAEAMAGSSGSGYMGTGERVSEDEAKFLADIKAHLRK